MKYVRPSPDSPEASGEILMRQSRNLGMAYKIVTDSWIKLLKKRLMSELDVWLLENSSCTSTDLYFVMIASQQHSLHNEPVMLGRMPKKDNGNVGSIGRNQ